MQNWNDLIRTQLNNLASFPAKQTWKLGEWTYECHVRPEVANSAALPLVGNELGDVRVSLADQAWYIWDGAAWQSMGGGGGGAVNSVTASAPIASSGGANPNISLTGIVPAANGGTGLAAPGAVGNVLTSTGAGWASSAPATTSPAAPLTSLQFNNAGAFGGSASLTWNGSTLAVDGAVDRATAGTLTVGGTTATAITVGQVGVTTTFPGPVNLAGDVTTVGGTQFTTDAQFDGNVTFGNAASDNISFVGQVDTAITQEGIAAPAVSPAGTGRIYFDSGTNTFKASQNGGAYVDLISAAVTPSAPLNSVQFNNAGAFGGSANLTYNSGTSTLGSAAALNLEAAADSTWNVTGANLTLSTTGGGPGRDVTIQSGNEVYINAGGVGDSVIVNGPYFPTNFQVRDQNFGSQPVFFVDGSTGFAGFKTSTPASLLSVGATSQFQVDSSGNIVAIRGQTTSFPAANAAGALTNDGAGNLSWTPAGAGTITGSGTATQIAYFTGASAIGSETAVGSNSFTWDATNNRLGVGTATPAHVVDVQAGTLAAGVRAVNASATLDSSANQLGFNFAAASAGSAAGFQIGASFVLNAGYTGNNLTAAMNFANNALGTGTTVLDTGAGVKANVGGLFNTTASTSGANAAGHAIAGGSTSRNYGLVGIAYANGGSPQDVGVYGTAWTDTGTPTANVGGMFTLYGSTDSIGTLTTAALIADNGGSASPIFLARDNGTTTFSVGNDGVVLAKNTANSTAAFQVQNAASTTVLDVDTTNQRVGVRTAAPAYTVDVQGGTLASGDRSLNVEGTLTSGGSNTLAAFTGTVTSGTFAQGIGGGLTGSGTPVQSFGAYIGNSLAGTGTDPINLQGNTGVHGNATGSTGTGHNVGMLGYASQGARNYGMFGNTTLDGAGANVAVAGVAKNASGVRVAGLFSNISITAQPNVDTSAVLIADNNNTSDPIFLARDAGTTVFTIANDGAVTSKNTANSTTAFQVQDASSTTIFDVDTTNDRVGILTTTPNEALTVNGVLSLAEGTAPSATASFGKFYALSSDSRPYFLDDGGQAYNLTLDRFNTLTPAASVAIDTSPALPVFNSIALNQNTTFTTSNLGNGRSASVRVVCDASTRTLSFPGTWTWLGSGPPSSLAANDVGYLSITAYGATDADVVAAWSYENAPAAVTGSGTATRVAFWDTSSSLSSSSNLYWDSSNSRLGVQTATPLTALDLASGQLAIPDGSAAAPAIAFRDDLNAGFFSPSNDIVGVAVSGTEIARLQQSGAGSTPALLMGTSTVLGAITVDSSDPSVTAGVAMLAHGAAGTTIQESYRGGQFAGIRTRGTKAAPTQVGTDDGLWSALGAGYTSAAGYNYGALITFKAEQAYTATASGGRIEFHTTLNGTDGFTTLGGSTTERMRIGNDGRVSIGTTAATHTFNIGSGASANFCVASGGRIHTYDGTAPTNGQVLIGDTASGNFAKATITAGTGISVTNGAGSITIAATGAAASSSIDVTGYVAKEALNAGDLVRFVDDTGTPKVEKADATNTDARLNPVGFAVAAALAGAAVTVRVAGVTDVPAARFDAAPAVTNVGQRVFVSTTSGQITLTAPSASGDILQRVGVLVDGSGSPKVLVQIGDPTLL